MNDFCLPEATPQQYNLLFKFLFQSKQLSAGLGPKTCVQVDVYCKSGCDTQKHQGAIRLYGLYGYTNE